MGRKDKSKAREKKVERKLMEMKMNAGWRTVKTANNQTNPLQQLPSFTRFNRNGVDLEMETKRVTSLDLETRNWIFDLMERT